MSQRILSEAEVAILQVHAELQSRGVMTISNQMPAELNDGFITLL